MVFRARNFPLADLAASIIETRKQKADRLADEAMENITKADLKDLLKDLKTELKAEIKESVKESVKDTVAAEFSKWAPGIDKQIHGLQVAVDLLQQHVFRDQFHDAEEASAKDLSDLAASKPPSPSGDLRPLHTPRASGHGVASHTRTAVDGVLGTPATPPANGMVLCQNPSIPHTVVTDLGLSGVPAPPSMPFPVFDGENPHLWKDLCEQYFSIYNVHESYWVHMATLNFSPTTAVWLQSVRKKLLGCNWESLCSTLCVRFGRDRHQLLIRQFYAIRQKGSVQEYIDTFEQLMNQLLAYSDEIHPYYFLMRFVGGLRADLRAAVMVQRPPDLDAACSLALVQEEVQEGVQQEHVRYTEPLYKPIARAHHQALPPQQHRPASTSSSVDRRGLDAARPARAEPIKSAAADPMATLRAYRRARGLCFKCGERWGHDHVCPATIQMHVLEELMDFVGISATEDDILPLVMNQKKQVWQSLSRHSTVMMPQFCFS